VEDASNPFSLRFAQTKQSHVVRNACEQSQRALLKQLQLKNIDADCMSINDVSYIATLIELFNIDIIGCAFHPSWYFQSLTQKLKDDHPDIEHVLLPGNTLFNLDQLPFSLDGLPKTFSQFRKAIEPFSEQVFAHAVEQHQHASRLQSVKFDCVVEFTERHAREHLEYYFSSTYPQHYKQTRNQLCGTSFSTGFSPYLAHGLLSVKEIVVELAHYERLYGRNESTEWIYFELLWREYFYWYATAHGRKLFSKSGLKHAPPLTSFYAQHFKAWCDGYTPSPLVNAIMRELKTTGWISNRARQISASYLINELGLDWRHGAAYFEQVLIDYDVAINWGNWQYIAGVGADPRGGRHFNLEKQTQLYDPDGLYRARWLRRPDEAYAIDHQDWTYS
jgi:deoxyribodipyrimidine photo-lyase